MSFLGRFLFLMMMLVGGTCSAQVIQDIRLASTPSDGVRFVADLDKKAEVKIFRLEKPSRLVMDFAQTRFHKKVNQNVLSQVGFIKGGRLGNPNQNTARIVLDLPNEELNEKHFILTPQSETNWRFVVDLNRKNKGAEKQSVPPPKTPSPKKKVVVLDPGHGGQDPGAISASGKYEKDLVLKMAKETKEMLEKAGYKVVLTRSTDIFITLRGRIKKAHEANADLFISIHADSSKNRSAKGLSIYTISEKASDKEAAALAERENKADILYGMDLADYQPEVGNILIDFAKKYAMEQSSVYADYVVREMKSRVQLVPNAHRFAGFVVLKSPNIPSVLLEMGYLSNRQEEKLMWKKSYRQKLSKALVQAVKDYFKNNPAEN